MNPLVASELKSLGNEMYSLLEELFPICRSITGNGLRETLTILQKHLPIRILEIPSGTEVFDWKVPDEWNIFDAYILDPSGKKIIDFKENNLHVLGYSEPVDASYSLSDLKKHLYTLPDLPEAIPYLTSYYKRRWGFCMSYNDYQNLKEGIYKVKIESTLMPGSITLGDCVLPGEEDREVILSCYTCHPSMANDSLSGVILAVFLGKLLKREKRRFTYRILFNPETIGTIAYLSKYKNHFHAKSHAGLILSMVGDEGDFRFKKSRQGNSEIDRVVEHVMKHRLKSYQMIDFYPHLGSDERQFCSPGFNLPFGLLTRTPYLECKEYHSSLDNLSFVSAKNLTESLELVYEVLLALETNQIYINQVMNCEPFLSKHGLYQVLGGQKSVDMENKKLQWVLNFCDSEHDLLSIAEKSGYYIGELSNSIEVLLKADLIRPRNRPE